MGILSKFRRRKNPYAAVTEEERIARYVYLLNTLPASVIESAHEAAFKDLSARAAAGDVRAAAAVHVGGREQRRPRRPGCARRARPARGGAPRRARSGRCGTGCGGGGIRQDGHGHRRPERRVDPRDVMMRTGVMGLVAYQFLMASSVSAYFTVGAGSLVLGDRTRLGGRHRRIRATASMRRIRRRLRRRRRRLRRRWLRRRLRRRRLRRRLRWRRRLRRAASMAVAAASGSRRRAPAANAGPMSEAPPRLECMQTTRSFGRSRSSASTSRAATSRRRSPTWRSASTRARPTSCCSVRPEPASRRRRPGSSSRCSARRSCWPTTRRSPRSSRTSSAT